jgi:hypothetical protein
LTPDFFIVVPFWRQSKGESLYIDLISLIRKWGFNIALLLQSKSELRKKEHHVQATLFKISCPTLNMRWICKKAKILILILALKNTGSKQK